MIEVHLIGYTEDGSELVFDLDPEGEGRYVLAVDPDLLATMTAIRAARVAHGSPVDARPSAHLGELPPPDGDVPGPSPSDPDGEVVPVGADAAVADVPPPGPAADLAEVPEPELDAPSATEAVGEGDREQHAAAAGAPARNGVGTQPRAALSPAEIQRRLRSGRSVTAVAQEAGVEVAWIERWLPPIVAERDRVLADAWNRAVGEGTEPLRAQVEEALDRRGAPADRTVWSAARRADGRWRVSVRFPEEGRSRSATWTLRAEGGPLSPASPLADELYPAAGRRRRR